MQSKARCFDLEAQRRFAGLSGDFNPLHLDPVYGRRLLFGEPVVHGIHLALWSLEQLLGRIPSPVVLKDLKATFRNPLPLNTPVTIDSIELENDGFEVRCSGHCCELTGAILEGANVEAWSVPLPSEGPKSKCAEISFAQAARASGFVSLFLDRTEFRDMFPRLAEKLPAVQVAQLLATTRLAGMECPGLHTIYDSFELHFAENAEKAEMAEMRYEIRKADERFSLVQLAVRSFRLEGTLSTFYRPPPVRQPSFSEVARKVRRGEFQHQRALVIGGSRGLGELTAKIVAAGGGDVAITYHRGKEDAERVVRELAEGGTVCGCFCLDVTQDVLHSLREGLGEPHPTHLYYFATPHIPRPVSGAAFSPDAFRRLSEYYVEGFSSVVEALAASRDSFLVVFYPSSVFVDTYVDGTGEYSAAKAAGECMCRYLQKRSRIGKLHTPRLPRMRTDQTASIGPRPLEDSLEVMLREIRELEDTQKILTMR